MDERSVDLHTHTTASDGEFAPAELVRQAKEKGLTAIAVTDHDTTDGVTQAQEAGGRLGIEVVPGIELSGEIEKGQCHILGLLIDPACAILQERLKFVREARANRNVLIAERLRGQGFAITLEEAEALAGGDVVARPHFARILVEKGYVASVPEAFEKYLAKGASCYVDRVRLSAQECIALIHQAGGVAILAHPNNLKLDEAGTEAKILELKALGLDGIEARYNLHTPDDTARYLALAEKHDLLTSGGSDFHGPQVKPTVFLGHVEGEQPAPRSVLDALRNRVA